MGEQGEAQRVRVGDEAPLVGEQSAGGRRLLKRVGHFGKASDLIGHRGDLDRH